MHNSSYRWHKLKEGGVRKSKNKKELERLVNYHKKLKKFASQPNSTSALITSSASIAADTSEQNTVQINVNQKSTAQKKLLLFSENSPVIVDDSQYLIVNTTALNELIKFAFCPVIFSKF